ncbi:MAG: DEAD/DEAH box helicase [bacterium]
MNNFSALPISEAILQAINKMGFEEMTEIQEQAIPLILAGEDIIGQSQTGTGKTAAFGIPLIEKCALPAESIQGIVITPTRELAVQVAEELNKIGQYKGVRTLPIYGGQDITRQIKALKKKPQIIVGTPGRLIDHLRRKTIRLQEISTVILDEADEMLNMGFIEDIEAILSEIPAAHQTLLFSATMPLPIQKLAQQFMRQPKFVGIKTKEITVPNIEQFYIEVPEKQKFDVLCRLLDSQAPELAIVFGRTKRRVDELAEALKKRGYAAEGIHGDLTQYQRDNVLHQFREGIIDILVATDVAARGLDIGGVSHVYNFDIPQDPERYVHRIGRTGRIGKAGIALTFTTPREINQLRVIEKVTKRKITRQHIPTFAEAMEGQQYIAAEKLLKVIAEENLQAYIPLAKNLLEENDSLTLVSAALKILTKEPNQTPVILTQETPPQRMPKNRKQKPAGRSFNKGAGGYHKEGNKQRRPRKKEWQ